MLLMHFSYVLRIFVNFFKYMYVDRLTILEMLNARISYQGRFKYHPKFKGFFIFKSRDFEKHQAVFVQTYLYRHNPRSLFKKKKILLVCYNGMS
jgi:hypothetical protein